MWCSITNTKDLLLQKDIYVNRLICYGLIGTIVSSNLGFSLGQPILIVFLLEYNSEITDKLIQITQWSWFGLKPVSHFDEISPITCTYQ